MMPMDPHIFRAYDIRGDVRNQLTPEAVFMIGRALGAEFGEGATLIIGRDAREHSFELSQKLVDGLTLQGANVIDLGQVTTPMVYFALHQMEVSGSVMVTGSHNPVFDNGLKICRNRQSFLRSDIENVRALIEHLPNPVANRGRVESLDISQKYIEAIHQRVTPNRRLRIVVDSGNGVAGPVAARVLAPYASELIELYATPDGRFPNHHPDPSVAKNLVDCQRAVLAHGADLGLALDGDGDRLGVIDRDGQIIAADKLIILYARAILSRRPRATIIGDVKCSKTTFDAISQANGQAVMSKTGHALIKAKMRESGAAFAGEMSGHFFFEDRWFGFDDALYAAARLMEIASESSSLGALLSDIPQTVATPEIRIDCPDAFKFKLSQAMVEVFKNRYPTNALDGARIDFPTGWALIRASNTEPSLVMRVEAETESQVEAILAEIRQEILAFSQTHGVKIGAF